MPNRTIVGLAILQANWSGSKRDYLETFIPLLAEVIRTSMSADDPVALASVQEGMKDLFGLDIPQNTIELLVRRLKKRGLLRSERGIYYPIPEALEELSFRNVQRQVLERHEELVTGFVKYCREKHQVELTPEQAETALQDFLLENEFILARKMLSQDRFATPTGTALKGTKYLVGSFVQQLHETSATLLSHFETVFKGSILANAIFVPGRPEFGRKFRGTEVYLDTTFLIYSLGYAGEPRQAPCTELLNLLYATGAGLCCFRHTLDEIRGALGACASRMERGQFRDAYGPSIEYFIMRGYSASDIRRFMSTLERDLQRLRVRVCDAPDYNSNRTYVIDEKALTERIQQSIDYTSERALQRDVRSISAIMMLRGSHHPCYLEESKAVLITTNHRLAQVVQDFFYAEDPETVAPCITDFVLTSLLWLKGPTSAPSLPRKRLIADSYAATQPNTKLWQSYLQEIDRLSRDGGITDEDYYLLRHDLQARTLLMERTLGEADDFARGTVQEILTLTKERLQADLKSEIESERLSKIQAQSEAELSKKELARQRTEIVTRAQAYGRANAKRVVRILRIGVLIPLGVAVYFTLPWAEPDLKSQVPRLVFLLLFAVLALLNLANLDSGASLKPFYRNLEVVLAERLTRRRLRSLGFDNNGELV